MNNMMSQSHQQSHPPPAPPQFAGNPPTTVGSAPTMGSSDPHAMMRNHHAHAASPPDYLQMASHNAPPMSPPAGLPWTVGSTDGTFATMTLMQQQQQQQQWNGGQSHDPTTGAAIGAAGEATNNLAALAAVQSGMSLYHDKLFHQVSSSTESVLSSCSDVMGFDIAEMWLRTGPKTHQLINSHLRPTALEDSVRKDLVEVYYGDKSSERTHRLSPALCKRAKDANDVVWVTAHTPHGAEALRCSISNVRTAVAVPVCHEASNTNITIIFFSIRRYVVDYGVESSKCVHYLVSIVAHTFSPPYAYLVCVN